MKYKKSIQIKAIVLLLVFLLNTVIGFSCGIGLAMEVNAHTHDKNTPTHPPVKDSGSHHFNAADNFQQQLVGKYNNKDNCCNDSVVKFAQLDKAVTNSVTVNLNNTFFTALVYGFYLSDVLSTSQVTNHIPLARWWFPLPSDIRVSIQSLQI